MIRQKNAIKPRIIGLRPHTALLAVVAGVCIPAGAAMSTSDAGPKQLIVEQSALRIEATMPLGDLPNLADRIETDVVKQELQRGDVAAAPARSRQDWGVAGGFAACPGSGSCIEPNFTPGCEDETCCNLVCEANEFCCDIGWDEFCAYDAELLCEVACTPANLPANALYSNAQFDDCVLGFFPHGSALASDNLWWQSGGGVIEEILFTIGNASASTLTGGVMELFLHYGAPGNFGGVPDSTVGGVLIEIDLAGIDLESETVGLFAIDISEGEIDLTGQPGVWAGIRFSKATFDGPGDVNDLGQLVRYPPDVGESDEFFWLEDLGIAILQGIPAALMWEITTDQSGEDLQTVFDTGRNQHFLILDQGAYFEVGVGLVCGHFPPDSPELWSATPFSLPEPTPAGGTAWNIRGIYPAGFFINDLPTDELHFVIWERNGFDAPEPATEVASGTMPSLGHGVHRPGSAGFSSVITIPVDFTLPAGDYYLAVYGTHSSGTPAGFAWFLNPANPILQVDMDGPWQWRSNEYPTPGFVAWSDLDPFFEIDPQQDEPDTVLGLTFFLAGHPVEEKGEPCPADLTGSGEVDVFDLLQLLSAWGPCQGCPEDLTENGSVDVFDLLQLLSAWGPCP